MGLLRLLLGLNEDDEDKKRDERLFYEEAKDLGMTDDEIEDAKRSGITPEEWTEENEEDWS